jgi:DNA-binding MarR family transcriptional regulator
MSFHRCDTRSCVNPDHLYEGTHAENMRDMVRRRRARTGSARGTQLRKSLLTEADVRSMRLRYAQGGISQEKLAAEFGIRQTAVSAIVRRKTWRHV